MHGVTDSVASECQVIIQSFVYVCLHGELVCCCQTRVFSALLSVVCGSVVTVVCLVLVLW